MRFSHVRTGLVPVTRWETRRSTLRFRYRNVADRFQNPRGGVIFVTPLGCVLRLSEHLARGVGAEDRTPTSQAILGASQAKLTRMNNHAEPARGPFRPRAQLRGRPGPFPTGEQADEGLGWPSLRLFHRVLLSP